MKPSAGGGERNLDRGCVSGLGRDEVGRREQAHLADAAGGIALRPGGEVGDDGGCVQRGGAVGERYALLQVDDEVLGAVEFLPALGNPRAQLALFIDVHQLVRDLAPQVAS